MSLILQLETSTTTCSVALAYEGQVIACAEKAERNIHAGQLTLFIKEVLKEAGKEMQDIAAVAVSKGPGSYTGLRIGVSTAKGLCYALDIPLISVSTLMAMASAMYLRENYSSDILLCPMIDARRMEVFTAIYNARLETILPVEAKIIDETSFSEVLENNQVVFFGDGADKCEELLGGKSSAVFYLDFTNSAKDLTSMAFEKYNRNEFENVAYFEPYYLKDFIGTQPKNK